MDPLDDLLQERLAQLEANVPLEDCLAGLPAEIATLVQKAARLRAAAETTVIPPHLAAQRSALLRFAQEHKTMSQPSLIPSNSRWFWPAVLASGVVLLVVCVAIVSQLAGGSSGTVVQNTTAPAEAVKAPDAQSAVLQGGHGLVEVQAGDGSWTKAQPAQIIKAGQRIRTGALSSVTLVFYDGSQAHLGPEAEIAVDTLDAAQTGARVIVLTQVSGESQHEVAKSADAASRYEVNTPAGVGSAKGTKFYVLVSPTLQAQFWVDEGAVNVTNMNASVLVVAGQATIVLVGQVPPQPFYRIMGEGQVTQIGTTWNIAGRPFQTGPGTVIVGNPQVGDWVTVHGHLSSGGQRVADKIVLLRPATDDTDSFTFTGAVESIDAAAWGVGGRTVQIGATTAIEAGLSVGEDVRVVGRLTPEGSLVATRISRLNAEGLKFSFTGLATTLGETTWTISGIQVSVNASTTIAAGLAVGDLVAVEGQIQSDGTWLATVIARAAQDSGTFAFTGEATSLSPWVVSGISFETAEFTEIDEGIQVGDRVRVAGLVQADGTWVATVIEKLEANPLLRFSFVGVVTSLDPWVVGGVSLAVDANTVIRGDIAVGKPVKVRGMVLADGTWLATEIKHTGWHWGRLGCLRMSTVVSSISGNQLLLLNGQALDTTNLRVEGQVLPASVIFYHFCVDLKGTATVIYIVVVYQLDVVPVIIIDNGNPLPPGCKISKKGNIKCSNK